MGDKPSYVVARGSLAALRVQTLANGNGLGTATAFTVQRSTGQTALVTNWHVLSGRHNETLEAEHSSKATPDELRVSFRPKSEANVVIQVSYRLVDDDDVPVWRHHAEHGHKVDIAVLDVDVPDSVYLYDFDLERPELHALLEIAHPVSVVGFPFGRMGIGGTAIWTRGFIASEPSMPFEGFDRMLIDSRTREGQSGAPVLIYAGIGTPQRLSNFNVNIDTRKAYEEFIGIYSGRIHKDSDIGYMWSRALIREVVEAGICPPEFYWRNKD